MKDRIKQVRKEAKATQQQFAESLGLKQNTIATYEMGRLAPSERTISDICRIYNVDEIWLRTGVGEMFAHKDREEEIAAYMGRLLEGKCSEFERAILSVMAQTTPAEWDVITAKAIQLAAAMKAKEKPDH